MALTKFWVIAYRDLVRNRRRTVLTLLAVALGMMVLILMSGMFTGVTQGALRENIRLNTGHLQLRAESYEVEKLSLLAKDLLPDSQTLAAQVQTLPQVESVAPVLWMSGILSTSRESSGVQVTGVDVTAVFHAPIRDGIVGGSYLTPDSRGQILLGSNLAEEMGIGVGQRISLAVGTSDGGLDEGIFTVAGLFDTGIPSYDQNTVVMPLAQAQTFARTGERASTLIVTLKNQEDTDSVAAALQQPGIKVLPWQELNGLFLELMQTGLGFYYMIYTIVILVVAVLIANTLLMSVFERTREMGILAALGMKGRQIMLMVLFEAMILALLGTAVGFIFGSSVVSYLAKIGIDIGNGAAAAVEGMALGNKMYPVFAPGQALVLALFLFAIVTLVSLYPARFAAKLEPVQALHTL
ncbi:MAG: ABC transporter permease [Anaerolineales bacterium]|nr:ABC transporter permease [Anaerolineales bacterium]